MMQVVSSAPTGEFIKRPSRQQEELLIDATRAHNGIHAYSVGSTKTPPSASRSENGPLLQHSSGEKAANSKLKISSITQVPSAKTVLGQPVATKFNGLRQKEDPTAASQASNRLQDADQLSFTAPERASPTCLASAASVPAHLPTPTSQASNLPVRNCTRATPQGLVSSKMHSTTITSTLPKLMRPVDPATLSASTTTRPSLHASSRNPPILKSSKTTNRPSLATSSLSEPLQKQQKAKEESVKQKVHPLVNTETAHANLAQQHHQQSTLLCPSIKSIKPTSPGAAKHSQGESSSS